MVKLLQEQTKNSVYGKSAISVILILFLSKPSTELDNVVQYLAHIRTCSMGVVVTVKMEIIEVEIEVET